MKIKILTIIMVLIIFLSGLNVLGLQTNNTKNNNNSIIQSTNNQVLCSDLIIESKNGYTIVDIKESDSFLMEKGKPMIPVITKTFIYPIGTKIKHVDVITNDKTIQDLDQKIRPSPAPIVIGDVETDTNSLTQIMDKNVYLSSELYPEKIFNYRIKVGIEGIKVIINYYPLRYRPAEDKIEYINNAEIHILYEEGNIVKNNAKKYDMVIITPRCFKLDLLKLSIHKNLIGVKTFIKTTEQIYRQYPGRDEAEQVKYFIKDAKENYDIKYVLLVGGRKGQLRQWYVPVRNTRNDDYFYPHYEPGTISDLYYSDIYKYNETSESTEFDDWDSNGNDVFAEWIGYGDPDDILDCDPDVYVGRLACRNKIEVQTVVDKIVKYERSYHLPFWAKRMVIAGGDTSNGPIEYDDVYEGELETSTSAGYMENLGFEITSLFASDNTLSAKNMTKALNIGETFVHMAGHGNPSVWSTHPPNANGWIDALDVFHFYKLLNGRRLPVMVIGGCHNSQINVTLFNMIRDIREYGLLYYLTNNSSPFGIMTWIPECFSWRLVSKPFGGAIATIGNSGLGWGYSQEYALEGLGGYIETHFFYFIGKEGITHLGDAHGAAISDFVEKFSINNFGYDADRKTVEQWLLLGDPSLKFGGYFSSL